MSELEDLQLNLRIGNMIRTARIDCGMTQVELATLADSAQSVISEIENGETGITVVTLQRLAEALNLQLKIVMERKYETK